MSTLWLRVRAPFAAYRWMQAGVWRATSPVMPHSAAWGLVLNLAGVETRLKTDDVTTLVDPQAPSLRVAVGEVAVGEQRMAAGRTSLYQQLHSYPVGNSGAELAERTFGAKYWIAPTRRELLVELDCILGVQSDSQTLLDNVVKGLNGTLDVKRYGLPFAGDNNLLLDRVDVLPEPPPAFWYEVMSEDSPASEGSCRLTVSIDRADSSRTVTRLFAPTGPHAQPPEPAWVDTGPLAA
ncbi:MAG: type I-E CRISPR-associated protein Cas5/CasD [Myxococcota bacterium]